MVRNEFQMVSDLFIDWCLMFACVSLCFTGKTHLRVTIIGRTNHQNPTRGRLILFSIIQNRNPPRVHSLPQLLVKLVANPRMGTSLLSFEEYHRSSSEWILQ